MARPEIKITDEMCVKAESLAARGLTIEQIASVLVMGTRTLYEKQANYPQLSQAIKDGRSKGVAKITNALFEKASNGDNTAMIFYLKNRDPDNWRDRYENHNTLSGPGGGPIAVEEIRHTVVDPRNTDS